MSFYVNTHNTGIIDDNLIQKCLENVVDLTPKGIREKLSLNNPIYEPTSAMDILAGIQMKQSKDHLLGKKLI